MKRCYFISLIFFLFPLLSLGQASVFTENNELLLALEFTDGTIASESLSTYEVEKRIYLPLIDVLTALELKFELESESNTVKIYDENQETFITLDPTKCFFKLPTEAVQSFDCNLIVIDKKEVFLSHQLWGKLLQSDFELVRNDSKIIINSQRNFPPQKRRTREKRKVSQFNSSNSKNKSSDYKKLTPNWFDGFGWSYVVSTENETNKINVDHQWSFNVLGAENYIEQKTIDNKEINTKFQTLWLTPNHEVQLFSIENQNFPLIGSTGDIKGLYYNSDPMDEIVSSSNYTLQEPIADGWEVEIYQDLVLVAKTVSSNGLIKVENLNLTPGNNVFKIIFYGPQGQTQEKFKVVNLDPVHLKKNISYNFFAGTTKDDNRLQNANLQLGLTPSTRAGFGLLNKKSTTSEDDFLYFNLNQYWNNLNFDFKNWFHHQDTTQLQQFEFKYFLQQGFASYSTLLNSNFKSPFYSQYSSALLEKNSFRFVRNFNLGIPTQVYVQLNEEVYAESKNYDGSIRTSTNFGNFYLLYELTQTDLLKNTLEGLIGSAHITSLSASKQFQFQLNHTSEQVTDFSPSVQFQQNKTDSINLGFTLNKLDSNLNSLNINLNQKKYSHLVSAFSKYNQNKEFTWGVTVSNNLWLQPRDQKLFSNDYSVRDYSVIKVFVFEDENENGIWDPNEKPLPNLKISVDGQTSEQKTDSQGFLYLKNFSLHNFVTLQVDYSSISDPYLNSTESEYRLFLSSGTIPTLQIPMNRLSEVIGQINFDAKTVRPGGLKVVLQSLTNPNESLSTLVQSDGFFYFPKLKKGTYKAFIDPASLGVKGLKSDTTDQIIKTLNQDELTIDLNLNVYSEN